MPYLAASDYFVGVSRHDDYYSGNFYFDKTSKVSYFMLCEYFYFHRQLLCISSGIIVKLIRK